MHSRESNRFLIIGAGAIGASWARLALDRGVASVTLVDPDESALAKARDAIAAAGLGLESRLTTIRDIAEAPPTVDFVMEAAPENLELKQRIVGDLDARLGPEVVIASSTSSFPPTVLQAAATSHPERVLVAHPFNPPHLMPLVEIVAGESTSDSAMDAAMEILSGWGKTPVRLSTELPGHIANRLQAALWREAYYLVTEGLATVKEVDAAVSEGPGLRWALLGPFATQHLSGGAGGFRHLIEHLGASQVAMWAQLGTPDMSPENTEALVASVERAYVDADARLSQRRDDALLALLDVRREHGL